jgi:hypothetical protein
MFRRYSAEERAEHLERLLEDLGPDFRGEF